MTPTNEDLLALADRADSWNRCYPGNLNVELLVDDLSAALRAIVAERDRLRAERMEIFGDHAHVVRGIIAAAGALPDMHDGPFKDGFLSGIEEVAARADIHAGDGGRQMLDLAGQIVDLVHGDACIVMLPAREVIEKMARAAKAEAERDRLRDALHRISLASSDSGTSKESLGHEARAALKGQTK